jgi:DNA-nicking Smr family endonuclease
MARSDPPAALEIDLHGCTVEQAQRRLRSELARARALRMTPLLVVTGRGFGSPGGTARLKPAVEAWLRGVEGRGFGVRVVRETARGGALLVELGA